MILSSQGPPKALHLRIVRLTALQRHLQKLHRMKTQIFKRPTSQRIKGGRCPCSSEGMPNNPKVTKMDFVVIFKSADNLTSLFATKEQQVQITRCEFLLSYLHPSIHCSSIVWVYAPSQDASGLNEGLGQDHLYRLM